MKKTLVLFFALALLMASCFPTGGGKRKAEPKHSAAKESVWDYYLIGSWQTDESIETFCGDGSYRCCTVNKTYEGSWRLDDTQDYVVWVTISKVKSGNKTVKSQKKTIKYVINALAPNQYLTFQAGEKYRTASWVK